MGGWWWLRGGPSEHVSAVNVVLGVSPARRVRRRGRHEPPARSMKRRSRNACKPVALNVAIVYFDKNTSVWIRCDLVLGDRHIAEVLAVWDVEAW